MPVLSANPATSSSPKIAILTIGVDAGPGSDATTGAEATAGADAGCVTGVDAAIGADAATGADAADAGRTTAGAMALTTGCAGESLLPPQAAKQTVSPAIAPTRQREPAAREHRTSPSFAERG